jgi:hypothetical protein
MRRSSKAEIVRGKVKRINKEGMFGRRRGKIVYSAYVGIMVFYE